MRGAYSAAICCCALVATVADSAGSTTTLSTIRLRDVVSLVFPPAATQTARVRQVSRREVHAAVQPANGCQPARYRAADSQSVIDSVSVRCHRNGTLEAIVRTREDVVVASHSTDAHFYLDLKVAGPAANATGPAAPSAATRRAAASPLASRAEALAAKGRVKDLATLLDSMSPADRVSLESGGQTSEQLLDFARERQLQIDRELFLNASDR